MHAVQGMHMAWDTDSKSCLATLQVIIRQLAIWHTPRTLSLRLPRDHPSILGCQVFLSPNLKQQDSHSLSLRVGSDAPKQDLNTKARSAFNVTLVFSITAGNESSS